MSARPAISLLATWLVFSSACDRKKPRVQALVCTPEVVRVGDIVNVSATVSNHTTTGHVTFEVLSDGVLRKESNDVRTVPPAGGVVDARFVAVAPGTAFIGTDLDDRTCKVTVVDASAPGPGDAGPGDPDAGGGGTEFEVPRGVALDVFDRIYVTHTPAISSLVIRMDDMTGANALVLGSVTGSEPLQFNRPRSIALDSRGSIYVADTDNDRIARVDELLGAGWITFGVMGNGVGQLADPHGLFVSSTDQRIYIADSNNDRLVRIDDMAGSGWTELAVPPEGPLFYPTAVSLDSAANALTDPLILAPRAASPAAHPLLS